MMRSIDCEMKKKKSRDIVLYCCYEPQEEAVVETYVKTAKSYEYL